MARHSLIAAIALLGTAFCTTSIIAAEPNTLEAKLLKSGYTTGEVVDKVQHYKVDGWNDVDDRHIIIQGGPSERYLVTLMSSCHDLMTAETIGFSTTVGDLTKFDKLVVRGPGGIKQDCPITEIHKLNKVKKDQ